MQPQLIRPDGSTIPLNDEQYRQVLDVLGLDETPVDKPPPMTDEEFDALEAEIFADTAGWNVSTDDLLEERRREREIEHNKEKRYGIE